MFQNVRNDRSDTTPVHESALCINSLHVVVVDSFAYTEGVDVIDSEGKNISITNRINNCVAVELIAKGLSSRPYICLARGRSIFGKNRCSSKTKKMIVPECARDVPVHISKLTSVALIED